MASFSEDFRKRLLERYEQQSKTFFKIFTATIVFAVAFLAFILVPYIGLQHDEKAIPKEQAEAEEQHEQLSLQLQELNQEKKRLKQEQEMRQNQRAELQSDSDRLEAINEELSLKIENIQHAIDKSKKRAGKLNEKHKGYDRLSREASQLPVLNVDQFVIELQGFLPKAAKVVYERASIDTLGIDADCASGDRQRFYNCLIKVYVMGQLSNYSKAIDTAVVMPMRLIDADGAAAAEQDVKQAIGDFERILDREPGFWKEVTRKRHVGRQFKNKLDELSSKINRLIDTQLRSMEQLFGDNLREQKELEQKGKQLETERADLLVQSQTVEEDLKNLRHKLDGADRVAADLEAKITETKGSVEGKSGELDALMARKSQIAKDKSNIEARIKNVKSPFGTLPIGLNEAFQIFPLVVAIGVLIYSILIGDLIALRSRFHIALRETFPDERDKIDDTMAMLAPIFVDPAYRLGANLWRAAVLCLPVGVYLISVGLIFHSWALDESVKGSAVVIRNMYLLFYVISVALIVLPAIRIGNSWRRYS